ncbi:ubiquitin-conjugating enzyme [Salix suchowensis]|nr:ubiquitin-conjugating enzyme [Salix suchowensis]
MKETTTSSSAPSRKALSKIACNRLQKELGECQLSPPQVPSIKPPIVSNEIVVFPEHYLTEAPQVNFAQQAPLHPHIYSDGNICLAETIGD